MLKRYFIAIFLILSSFFQVFSQGELDLQPRLIYRNERSGAIYLNSNGIGAGYRYGQRITARNQKLYEVDFLSVKHPKEIRISNSIDNSRSFVFGKENTFFELRGMYGKQNEIFRKNDRGGVSVRYFYTGGPAVGIIKPIYYEVLYSTGLPFDFYIQTEKYNASLHQSNIYGRSSFTKGLKEISLAPGASLKAGFSFEYSRQDIKLHSLDAGFTLDLFARKIPIMATTNNDFLFFNLFVSYRFGRSIDISEAAMAASSRKKEERQIRRKVIRDQKKQEKEEFLF